MNRLPPHVEAAAVGSERRIFDWDLANGRLAWRRGVDGGDGLRRDDREEAWGWCRLGISVRIKVLGE